MKMKEMCMDERPREKMRTFGAAPLSNAELLAILLRSGTSGKNVMEVSSSLMKDCDGRLRQLSAKSLDWLCAREGIGESKALTILAAFELGRRAFSEADSIRKKPVTSARDIWEYMIGQLRGKTHEEFWAIYLNRANYIIDRKMLSSGSLTSTTVDEMTLVTQALEKRALGVIIVHNHPSGNPIPGSADREVTNSIRKALEPLKISLLDHVVICDEVYFSFADDCAHSVAAIRNVSE